MQTPTVRSQRSLPAWLRAAVWLAAFVSPTAYFISLILAAQFQIPVPPTSLLATLLVLTPVVALGFCELVIWQSDLTLGWKIGGMLFTLVAMLLQVGILVAILQVILIAMTGYAQ